MRTHIRSNTPCYYINWRELRESRDLLWMLVVRDLTAIYKQTVLGPFWFLIQPFLTSVVFTVVFGHVARVSTDGIPHFVFYLGGIVFWNYFQGVLAHSAGSLMTNSGILAKVYIPRLLIPVSAVLVNAAFLALNYAIFAGFYLWAMLRGADIAPNRWLLLQPLLILQCGAIGMGFGLWVCSMTIKYRDMRFALPFLTQLWMYATPIVYPASLVVRPIPRAILWLNPMTAVVEFSRYGLTGKGDPYLLGLSVSWTVTLVVLASGVLLFNKVQRTFVDTI